MKKITEEMELLKNNLDVSHINYKEFQEFANGLFQAEGTCGVYFPNKDSLRVVFSLSIGQNYSKEAALLFLRLQVFLSGIGKVKVEHSTTGEVYIKYTIHNSLEVIEKAAPYFKYVYGSKKYILAYLVEIYNLSIKLKNIPLNEIEGNEDNLKLTSKLIHLIYSTNLDGQPRKISLKEKLSIFNCLGSKYTPELEVIPENINLPSKLFIIGIYLGDGSQGFVFDERKDRGVGVFYIKPLFNFVSQKVSESNLYLLTFIAKSLGFKPSIHKKANMISLSYSGKFVFETILPFLSEFSDWLYWRQSQFEVAKSISEIYKNKRQLTKEGYIEIVKILYSVPNNYGKPKEYWLNLIEKRVWK